MSSGGVYLPFGAVAGFSPSFQAELSEYVRGQMAGTPAAGDGSGPDATDEGEEPADLSVAQAKKFLARVSDKVRATLRVIAECDASGFNMDKVVKALKVDDGGDLRGVWGGITKRVRTVLGDDEAYLIWWTEREDGSWTGRVSEATHRSLRKVFGI